MLLKVDARTRQPGYKPLHKIIIMVQKVQFTALDYEILNRAKNEMARENILSYTDYFLRTKNNAFSASSPSGSSGLPGCDNDSYSILGYRIEVAGSPNTKIDKDTIMVSKEEASVQQKIEERKKLNKQIIKK
jgi:hypothetical protein